jgi:nitroreductase
MNVDEAIRGRRSIRRFLPEPVPEAMVWEIIEEARWAPSWANTQSWSIYVLSGEPLERFKSASAQMAESGAASTPDLVMPSGQWPDRMAARTKLLFERRAPFTPPPAGAGASKQGTPPALPQLFGAPCFLVLAFDESLASDYACFDAGLLAQTICLAAYERELGTCIMAMSVRYPQLLRKELPELENERVVIGIALGYQDREAPINGFQRERAEVDELVTWVG